MGQLGGGACLATKPFLGLGADRDLRRKNLDGDGTLEGALTGQVHRSHTTTTEKSDHLVLLADRVFQCHKELVVRNRYDLFNLCAALEAKRGTFWEVSTAMTAVHAQGVSWLGDRKSP